MLEIKRPRGGEEAKVHSKQALNTVRGERRGPHRHGSTTETCGAGKEQGSILGPLIFTLSVNGLQDSCPNGGFQMYSGLCVRANCGCSF